MTFHTFGTLADSSQYIEIPDPAYVDPAPDPILGPRTQTLRPPAGTVVKVKDADTGLDLPDIVTSDYGYFAYVTDGIEKIIVSGDGGVTWSKPWLSSEAQIAAGDSGQAAADALAAANQAATTVGTFDARLTVVETAGPSGVGASTVDAITDAGSAGKAVLKAADAAAARAALGAGTSSLQIGTTPGTAKAGDYAPTVDQVSGLTVTGKAVAKAADAAAARSALSLDQVNNTSDANKPVSTAQAAALAGKQPKIRHYADEAAANTGLVAGEFADGDLITVG